MIKSIALIAFLFISCTTHDPLSVDNLKSPRGLFLMSNGNLLISEVAAGRILEWNPDSGALEVLLEGLPFTEEGPELVPAGVSAAVSFGGKVFFIVGEHRAKGFRELYRASPNSIPEPITGQIIQGLDPPNRITNPYDIVLAPNGGFFVSDAGRDSIWHISEDGIIKDYMVFDSYSFNLEDGTTIPIDVVPTGMVVGLDQALYVSSLTGFPFPTEAGNVYRLEDLNDDGDALDLGESTVYASGFTAATDLAFDLDGSLLVTEFSSKMKELSESSYDGAIESTGRVVKWDGESMVVLESGLVSPTALVVSARGRIFVSEEFAGRITEIKR